MNEHEIARAQHELTALKALAESVVWAQVAEWLGEGIDFERAVLALRTTKDMDMRYAQGALNAYVKLLGTPARLIEGIEAEIEDLQDTTEGDEL